MKGVADGCPETVAGMPIPNHWAFRKSGCDQRAKRLFKVLNFERNKLKGRWAG